MADLSEYVKCRTIGHAWDDITGSVAPHQFTFLDGARVYFQCIRCTTKREDIWSRVTGDLMARQYTYPADYKITGDMPSRPEFRLMYLRDKKTA
jgi:hypothetical protein